MKEAIIKSIAAIVCAAIFCATLLYSTSTYSEAEVKAAEISSSGTPAPEGSVDNTVTSSPETSIQNEITPQADTPEETVPEAESSDKGATEESTVAQTADNPTEWAKERIVSEYKAAAAKSHSGATSQHKISIEEIKVNGKAYDGITGLMGKLLANNSEDKEGITGGHQSLVADDVASAKAYKSGNNTVIEMTMKDQVAGPSESDKSGSVGHAITVVGDISSVTKQITDLGFPLDINEKETKIYYTKPTVKVVINEDGKIINGTWQYTVEISLKNYTVLKNVHVDSTSILMVNTLTVGGGFKK